MVPGSLRQQRDRRGVLALFGTAGILLLGAGLYRAALGPIPAPALGGPFSLRDPDGRLHGAQAGQGRWELVFFGYTQCTDTCPRTLIEMSEALGGLDPGARRIQPLFITVDPVHDTPAALRRYTSGFSSTLIGLTGDPATLAGVRRAYHVVAEQEAGEAGYDHSAALFVLDPAGRVVSILPADTDRRVLQARLRALVPALPAA